MLHLIWVLRGSMCMFRTCQKLHGELGCPNCVGMLGWFKCVGMLGWLELARNIKESMFIMVNNPSLNKKYL